MPTTATKPTTASAELAPLQAKRDKLHAAARAARQKRDDYDLETERMRSEHTQDRFVHGDQFQGANFQPVPGTPAAEMQAEIKERMRGNPHAGEYEQARAEFHEVDADVQRFRRERILDLIVEDAPAGRRRHRHDKARVRRSTRGSRGGRGTLPRCWPGRSSSPA